MNEEQLSLIWRGFDLYILFLWLPNLPILKLIESLKNIIYKLQSSKINVEKELLDNDHVKKYNIILHLRNNST